MFKYVVLIIAGLSLTACSGWNDFFGSATDTVTKVTDKVEEVKTETVKVSKEVICRLVNGANATSLENYRLVLNATDEQMERLVTYCKGAV